MTTMEQLCADYQRIEEAIAFLERNFLRQPALGEIADHLQLSEYHFQRLFSRWVGISPKRFLQYLTKEYAKKRLQDSENVFTAALDAGLSGGGRLHDLFVTCEAVTPGEYRRKGGGMEISRGFFPTPFGEMLLAATERGVCALHFMAGEDRSAAVAALEAAWPGAVFSPPDERLADMARRMFHFSRERPAGPLHLHVRGTNFQIKVWEALMKIPLGSVVAYEDVARHIGHAQSLTGGGQRRGQKSDPFSDPLPSGDS